MAHTKYPPIKVGEIYGRLTILIEANKKTDQRCWLVKCVCGVERVIRQVQLKNGSTQSCGCIQRERAGRKPKHGHTIPDDTGKRLSTEYSAWNQMKQWCTNPNTTRWKDYGGRGITVCDRWLNSFEAFLQDVGPKPTTKDLSKRAYSLGRIDNDKGYEPGNVEWQTYLQQSANKRSGGVKVGETCGTLTVTELVEPNRCKTKCLCGKEKTFGRAYLRARKPRCPCSKNKRSKRVAQTEVSMPIKIKRKVENREPWQIALHEASERRKNK